MPSVFFLFVLVSLLGCSLVLVSCFSFLGLSGFLLVNDVVYNEFDMLNYFLRDRKLNIIKFSY